MIKINLLPPETSKRAVGAAKARSGAPSAAPFFAGLAVLYALAGYGFYWSYSQGVEAVNRTRRLTGERDTLKREVEAREREFEENNLRSREIEEKYAVVQALGPENRIYWSEKINMIAKARMNLAVYVTRLQLQERIVDIETQESIQRREEWRRQNAKSPQKTKEPAPVKRPVIYQTLIIDALAYGSDSSQRLRQVRAFYDALRNLEWTRKSGEKVRFLDRLAGEFETLPQKMAVVGGVDVLRFGFRIPAHQQGDTPPPPPPPPPPGGPQAPSPAPGAAQSTATAPGVTTNTVSGDAPGTSVPASGGK